MWPCIAGGNVAATDTVKSSDGTPGDLIVTASAGGVEGASVTVEKA